MLSPNILEAAEVQAVVASYAKIIGADPRLLPTFDYPIGDATPFIEIDDRYHFVISERGNELERRSTTMFGELLYWVFDGITSAQAGDWEMRNRRPGEDSRRQLFATQIALMRMLDPAWGTRLEIRLAAVRKAHPFDDRHR
jgi:hypothetical protein